MDWLDNMTREEIWIANKYLSTATGVTTTCIPSLQAMGMAPNTQVATSNDQKSELLASLFFPPPPVVSTVLLTFQYPCSVPLPPTVTDVTLTAMIAKLSPYKAPGPDSICNIVFKRCSDILSPHLLRLFRAMLTLDTFYDLWRDFTTVVLHKPGCPDYTLPTLYRLIALLNTTYKLLSAIVANQLSYLLEANHLLPSTHFSGCLGHSTTDSRHLLAATIRNTWHSNKIVSVLFLNIEGAFPNVVMACLLHNMHRCRIPAKIVSFIQQALHSRRTHVKFDGHTSDWIPINNRIGQGDPLSMILYIIYNIDLLDIPTGNEWSECAQAFVDDTMLLAVGKTFEETHATLKNMME